MITKPDGLGEGGSVIWAAFDVDSMPAAHVALLTEACRTKDRLDKLDLILRGDADEWMRIIHRTQTDDYELHIDDALAKANATATSLRQLLAALPVDSMTKPQVMNALDELRNRRAAKTSGPSSAARSGKRR